MRRAPRPKKITDGRMRTSGWLPHANRRTDDEEPGREWTSTNYASSTSGARSAAPDRAARGRRSGLCRRASVPCSNPYTGARYRAVARSRENSALTPWHAVLMTFGPHGSTNGWGVGRRRRLRGSARATSARICARPLRVCRPLACAPHLPRSARARLLAAPRARDGDVSRR